MRKALAAIILIVGGDTPRTVGIIHQLLKNPDQKFVDKVLCSVGKHDWEHYRVVDEQDYDEDFQYEDGIPRADCRRIESVQHQNN